MYIEVVTPPGTPTKEKGDLFERLAAEFLRTQGYAVETQVRVTGTELDLLCKNDVRGDLLYVECKAEREPLSATALRGLAGTVVLKGYSEGWLVSAGPLGKDAKGLKLEYEQQHSGGERRQFVVYDPDRIVRALIDARLIVDPLTLAGLLPTTAAARGDFVLVVAKAG